MFGFEGNFLREIALKGKPVSVAFTESGDLLVCNIFDDRIFLYTENGQFISYIGGEHVRNPWYHQFPVMVALSQVNLMTRESKFSQVMEKPYFGHSKPQIAMNS